MRITPLEVKEHNFKKVFRGYDPTEVDALKNLLSEVLEELTRENRRLENELKVAKGKIEGYTKKEVLLQKTITTAQKVAEDLKGVAKKEAEIIISEAKIKAEEIVKDGHHRYSKIQGDVERLKKQRIMLENEIKAIIEYHQKILFSENDMKDSDKIKHL